ncbi:MAG: L-seryl-tRNA(Sec) selenium transferase [Clostridiales bacterium]|nr:L-seryl-tRNA(Sec) selenium transferase [Clostridiales bacterium]
MMKKELLRSLPKIDEVLMDERISALMERIPRETVVDAVRDSVETIRADILAGKITEPSEMKLDTIIDRINHTANKMDIKSLRPVINATGVVLHTNLGRANLSEKALAQVISVANNYSTLEYDPEKGVRGSRHSHVENMIKKITGAEAAMAVNNNAAATMLVMAAIGRDREMIVSRGELVEIGGSFRIPDIMKESGAVLVEVGTTNKTRISDYESQINENTAALLKVHTSNYRVIGFTEDASLRELRELGDKYGLPVIYDMGSGLMTDLSEWGIHEPVVKEGLKDGADVILFSGDKLLGGPQAGIIAGKKEYIDKMKSHPLARVVRVDKMTIAALEATLSEYADRDRALNEIPVLRMITKSREDLQAECLLLKGMLDEIKDPEDGSVAYSARVVDDDGVVGGGSAPDSRLKNIVLAVDHGKLSPDRIEEALRKGEPPVIARIKNDSVIIDVRTVNKSEYDIIAERFREIAEKRI